MAGPADAIYDAHYVRGLFDRMSVSYERMNYIMSFGFSARWRRELLRLVSGAGDGDTERGAGDDRRSLEILDALCGLGETWPHVRRAFPEARLHALDFSPGMIAAAGRKNAKSYADAFALRCEDMLESSIPDASLDVVVCAYGLKTFDAAQSVRLAAELARVLRPGGRYAFVEVTEPPNRLLRALYGFYLERIVPTVGTLLASDPVEYRMLWRYLRDYGDGARSMAAFTAHPGLTVVRRLHFFGCATSFTGQRIAAR